MVDREYLCTYACGAKRLTNLKLLPSFIMVCYPVSCKILHIRSCKAKWLGYVSLPLVASALNVEFVLHFFKIQEFRGVENKILIMLLISVINTIVI